MRIKPFSIEQYFDLYEFTTPHLLCASDCETMSIDELLHLTEVPPAEFGSLRLGYTEARGNPELRTAVAQNYQSIDPEQILMLAAPEEGIYLTMRTLLEPGDHVVVLTPAYDSLLNLAEHVSGNVSPWLIQPTPSDWQLDLEELDQLVSDYTKLIVVNFPHNPTGFLPAPAELEAIIAIARRHGTWLFCDEMYRGLEIGDAETLPSAADQYERSIVLAGLSKVHGLPGLRSGWLVVQDEGLLEELVNWKHYTTICSPVPSEFLALAALRAQELLIARNRSIIAHNLQVATSFFERWSELFTWRPPQAGSVALVGLHQPSATDYCHHLAKDAGVLLLPSTCLGYGDKHLRFGFGRTAFPTHLAHYDQYLASAAME
jgi:aspartate/methionine/tyrosine aminotransferase